MRSIALAPLFLLAAALAAHAQVRYPARPGNREVILDEAELLKPEDAAEIRRLANEAIPFHHPQAWDFRASFS